ncbi:MAG: hypothetical protein JNM09_10935 [Blastocatellia bacterium]|nr:hypothetical protein [Blastocatellia bacterium]
MIKEQVDQKKGDWAREKAVGNDGIQRSAGSTPSFVNDERLGFRRGMAFAKESRVTEINADFAKLETQEEYNYAEKKECRGRVAQTAAEI